jgi:hypothetical protein
VRLRRYNQEIINANESEGGGIVAVLCKDGKEKMDKELAHFIKKKDMHGTKVRRCRLTPG